MILDTTPVPTLYWRRHLSGGCRCNASNP